MGGSKPTIGFRYYLGLHAGICVGPVDEIRAIYFDDREGWRGTITGNSTITIDKPGLFGGEKQEGGVFGLVDVMMGGDAQGTNSYLVDKVGPDQPGYRGLLSLVFRGSTNVVTTSIWGSKLGLINKSFYWSAMNPYIKPVSVELKRISSGWSNGVWYSAKAAIGDNMNPAHILYQAMTEPLWGAGLSGGLLDDVQWRAAADTLHAEGFGLSLIWVQQQPIEDFAKEILRHIDASLFFDSATGKFVLKLNRADYTVSGLPIYGPDEIKDMQSYRRAAWGETTNEIVVSYTDPATEDEATIAVQDLANVRIQNGIVSATKNYPGIRTAELAYRVAERDLRVVSTPLAATRFTVNRDAWTQNAGSVFRLSWPDYGIVDVVFRITEINRGSLTDGTLLIEAVEDVFALPTNSYGTGQGSGWQDPGGPPSNIVNRRVVEANYVDVVASFGESNIGNLSATQAYPIVLAERPSSQNTGFVAYAAPTNVLANYVKAADGENTPTLTIPAAVVDKTQPTVVYSTVNGFDADGDLGAVAYWDDEIVEIVSVSKSTNTLTIKRAILDTVPATHGTNSKIWCWDFSLGAILVESDVVSGETVYIRPAGRSTSQEVDLSTVTAVSHVGTARWTRPWPPADVKINGAYSPGVMRGDFQITWKGRNRLQQTTSDFVGWYDAHIAPEAGTTYTLEVYDDDTSTLIRTITGLTTVATGGTYTYPGTNPNGAARFRVKLTAVRAGVTSHQSWEHEADLLGYGLNYDQSYGGFSAGVVLPPQTSSLPPEEQYTPVPDPMWINGAWRQLVGSSIRVSTDNGVTWITEVTTTDPDKMLPGTGFTVFHAGSFYVALNGSGWYRYRKDGGLWKQFNATNINGYSAGGLVTDLFWDGTQWVLVKNEGRDLYTSPNLDNESWVHVGSTGSANQIYVRMRARFVVKMPSQYVAFGFDFSTGDNVISTSTDLISWSTTTPGVPAVVSQPSQYYYFSGSYFAIGTQGTNNAEGILAVYKSTDLITWTAQDVGAIVGTPVRGVAVTTGALAILAGGRVYYTSNGTTWSTDLSAMQFDPFGALAYYMRSGLNLDTSTRPTRILLYQPLAKEEGGKLIYVTGLTSTTATLLHPSDATNGVDVGVLGFFQLGLLDDSGFSLSNTSTFKRTAFWGRNTGKRYFEIKLASNNAGYSPSNSAPLISEIGIIGKTDYGTSNSNTGLLVNSSGNFSRDGFTGGNITVIGSYTFQVGQIIGILADFDAGVVHMKLNNVEIAYVSGIDLSIKWFPFMGAYLSTLELNTGQKAFAYSQSGYSSWRS